MARYISEHSDAILANELKAGESLNAPWRRVGGFVTLLALGGWVLWQLWASNYMAKNLLILNLSKTLSLQYDETEPLPSTDGDSGTELDLDTLDLEAVKTYLAEKRAKRTTVDREQVREARRRRAQELKVHQRVQAYITGSWMVIMSMTGVFMLCAAIAGIIGSVSSRRWHRLVVYWTLLACASTVAGVYALSRWGGFPAPNGRLIAEVATGMFAYAFLVIIALLLTRRTTLEIFGRIG